MKYLFIVICSISLISCGTMSYQIKGNCNKNPEDLFKEITLILINEGFLIKNNDVKLGYLQAETPFESGAMMLYGYQESKMWVIQINDSLIIASARINYQKSSTLFESGSGFSTYYSDKTHEDWSWYWSVRKSLDNICGTKLIVYEKKLN